MIMNFIHIGVEKTGTTQLQSFFLTNKKTLEKDFGINFRHSACGAGHSSDIINLVSEMQFGDLTSPKTIDIEELKNQHLLISSEHFSSRLVDFKSIEKLRCLLNLEVNNTIVAYLKPQEELLVGMYAEAMKAGRDVSSLPAPNSILEKVRYGRAYFDYWYMLKLWKEAFAENTKFIIVPYEREKLEGKDICRDFSVNVLKGYGNIDKLVVPNNDLNKTFSPEMLLSLRRFEEQFVNVPRHKIHQLLLKFDSFGKGVFLSQNELEAFREHFIDSNAKVAELIGVEELFSDVKNFRVVRSDYIMDNSEFNQIKEQVSNELDS